MSHHEIRNNDNSYNITQARVIDIQICNKHILCEHNYNMREDFALLTIFFQTHPACPNRILGEFAP